jgi:hypothetical protein
MFVFRVSSQVLPRLPPHFNRNIGAHLGAQCTAGAGPFLASILHGIVSALAELHADFQELLRARRDAELAALAIFYVDDNLAHNDILQKKVQSSEYIIGCNSFLTL